MPDLTRSVTLVVGGARSGKSRYAQQVAETKRVVVFLATATAGDEEMRAKIERHRLDRPAEWTTVEETVDLAGVIGRFGAASEIVLVDCLTFWAANLMEVDAEREIERLCEVLRDPPCSILLVSNEVGSGVVPEYESGRRFRDLLGEINQRVAAVATEVIWMVAGLPVVVKKAPSTTRRGRSSAGRHRRVGGV